MREYRERRSTDDRRREKASLEFARRARMAARTNGHDAAASVRRASSPPQPAAGDGPVLAVVGDHGTVERAIERRQHATLDEIEGRRLAIARARQVAGNLLVDAAGARPHHHDAVG